ncbi:MAG TPA: Gfo/Idh/MocA family oxidoreductase [Gemmatimonadaceae bacterium]|nr:Gfo/Idh/MocA family oxidoreductase [Gemmatimonadaceae bacterium]
MKIRSSRRQFLQASAAVVGGSLAVYRIPLVAEPLGGSTQQVSASDRVRFGMVGVGMQGSGLLSTAIALPGVQCAAACDLYDGRHVRAREIAGANLKTTRRYQELLADKDIDCIVAAVPDHWHRKIVVDAVSAGKDIYCEKPMSHSVADGVAMVAAAKKSGRIVQIGSQRTSSVLCAKARELVAKGVLGDLQLVEGSLGRNNPNGAWVYPPPPDVSPATLDWDTWQGDVPKRPFDPKIFARWRCWKEYGTGVAGDLMVHLISGMLYTWGINEAPTRVVAMGGIRRFKDGRNMPDVHMSLFEYGDVPVYIRLNLGSETPEVLRFLGSKGILELTETSLTFTGQAGVDTAPSYYASSFPQAMRNEYVAKWHAENDPRPGEELLHDAVSYRGDSYDDTRPHLWKFFQAVKTRQPVVQDAVFGHHAAIACHMANESHFQRRAMLFDPATETVKS